MGRDYVRECAFCISPDTVLRSTPLYFQQCSTHPSFILKKHKRVNNPKEQIIPQNLPHPLKIHQRIPAVLRPANTSASHSTLLKLSLRPLQRSQVFSLFQNIHLLPRYQQFPPFCILTLLRSHQFSLPPLDSRGTSPLLNPKEEICDSFSYNYMPKWNSGFGVF